jgi:DNA-binding NtrC family response regulator
MNRTEAFLEPSSQDVTELHKKSILIVDDEEDLIWSLSKTLSKTDEKLEIICVQDGDSALEVLSRRPVDVVVSDVRMPGRDGLQLLEEIRFNYPQTKVIIMTAYGSEEMQTYITARTPYYLEKPFEIQYLKSLIYAALEAATPPTRNRIYDPPSNGSNNSYSISYLPMISSLAMLTK